jgi:hypothetical protein
MRSFRHLPVNSDQFGRIQRACLIEKPKRNIKQAIPATRYEKPKKETTSTKAVFPALAVVGIAKWYLNFHNLNGHVANCPRWSSLSLPLR